METINTCLLISEIIVVSEEVDVVIANVSFLVECDLLDKYEMVVNNVRDVLKCHSFIITPLIRKMGILILNGKKNKICLILILS